MLNLVITSSGILYASVLSACYILNLINLQINKVNKFTAVINLRGVSTNNSIICFIVMRLNLQRTH